MKPHESTVLVRISLGVLAVAVLIALWWIVTTDAPPSIPMPTKVFGAARELVGNGLLFEALATSLGRVASGFAISLALGSALGIVMAQSKLINDIFDPIIETFRPIAPVALVPLAILWLGTGPEAAVALIAYSAFFPIVTNAYAAVRGISPSLIHAARTFGTSRGAIIAQVILPAATPGLIVGARVGIGLGWASVIAAELAIGAGVGQSLGVGQLMYQFYQFQSDPNPIVVCMIAVGLIGLLLDSLIRELGRLLLPWRQPARHTRARAARV